MKLQNGYQIIYSVKDKDGIEHFYAGKGTAPSKNDDVMVMVAGNKVVYGGNADTQVIIADGITLEDLKEITENGEYNIANFARVTVNVSGETPTGTLQITENNTYDVTHYANAEVNVPNPSTGTKNITTNGDHDVTAFATAHVAVPSYPEPTGKAPTITANANNINIKDYATVDVNVQYNLEPDSYYATDFSGSIDTGRYVTPSDGSVYIATVESGCPPILDEVSLEDGVLYQYDPNADDDKFKYIGSDFDYGTASLYWWDGGCHYTFTKIELEEDHTYKYIGGADETFSEVELQEQYVYVVMGDGSLEECGENTTDVFWYNAGSGRITPTPLPQDIGDEHEFSTYGNNYKYKIIRIE